MMKFSGVLLASDFDDTLVDDSCVLSRRNASAIKYFTENGGLFTVATGRSRPAFEPYAQMCAINAPAILSNGAAVYDFEKGSQLKCWLLPLRCAGDCRALQRALPEIGYEAYHYEDIFVHKPNILTLSHLKKVNRPARCLPVEEMPLPWVKVIFQHSHEMLVRARDFLTENYSEHYEVLFSNKHLLEMTQKGAHKGGALEYLAGLYAIDRENIFVIGDNSNDIPMMEVAKTAFAPRGMDATVASWGRAVEVGPCGDGAAADVIDILDGLY